MTDNDLLALYEQYKAGEHNDWECMADGLAAALRERDRQLETEHNLLDRMARQLEVARAVTRRLLEWWELDLDLGVWEPPDHLAEDGWHPKMPITDAERAWLASVSPPAREEEP